MHRFIWSPQLYGDRPRQKASPRPQGKASAPDTHWNRDRDADRGVLLILALTLAPFLFVLGLVLIN